MINQEVLLLLMKSRGKSKPRIYKEIKNIRVLTGHTADIEQATFVLASQSGIDISKYLDQEQRSLIRNFVDMVERTNESTNRIIKSPIPKKSSDISSKKSDLKLSNPFLKPKMEIAAKRNSEAYPYLFMFENTLREMISKIYEKEEKDQNWWKEVANTDQINTVKKRVREDEEHPWAQRRIKQPIYYTDITDLTNLINKNQKIFRKYFGKDLTWVLSQILIAHRTRLVVAHHNPLNARDVTRIKGMWEDWIPVMNMVKKKLDS